MSQDQQQSQTVAPLPTPHQDVVVSETVPSEGSDQAKDKVNNQVNDQPKDQGNGQTKNEVKDAANDQGNNQVKDEANDQAQSRANKVFHNMLNRVAALEKTVSAQRILIQHLNSELTKAFNNTVHLKQATETLDEQVSSMKGQMGLIRLRTEAYYGGTRRNAPFTPEMNRLVVPQLREMLSMPQQAPNPGAPRPPASNAQANVQPPMTRQAPN